MEITHNAAILEAALRYASAGVAVFPTRLGVRGNGKKDVRPIDDWRTASTTDPAVIRGWYGPGGAWEGEALCIDAGKSGIVGVDQDVTEGKNGIAGWEALKPAATWRVRTPTGGAHDYYMADFDHPVSVNNTGDVADGVDIRGQGGFLFAPPTRDPRGGSWRWCEGEPEWQRLPLMPAVVHERLSAAAAARRAKPVAGSVGPQGSAPQVSTGVVLDPLFMNASDFGPGGGYKKASAAAALVQDRLVEFARRTSEGSARSHYLSQELGVLAGHGAGVFWSYEDALNTLMEAAQGNGMVAVHGEAYVRDQARRGLDYGMRELWVPEPETVTVDQVEPELSDVERLLAEMLGPSEIIAKPPPRALVRGLLNLDSESWIIGAPGSKKSFVAVDMAAHVALGRPWQGRQVHQGVVVLIVAEGAGGLGPRLKAWELEHGQKLPDERIRILPRPVQAADLNAWAVLREACRRLEPALVVLDTQARVTVGLEENSAKEMGVFIEAVRSIREATGACVLTVHHTGRSGGDARGSSAIDGAQHTELKVDVAAGSLRGKLVTEKQKDMEKGADVELVFAVHVTGQDEDGAEVTSLALVADAFRKQAGQTGGQEREIVSAPPERITKWVERMIRIIVRDAPPGEGLTQAQVFRTIDAEYAHDKPKSPCRNWGDAKEAWAVLSADPRVVPIGKNRDVEDLETRARIESELGRKV